MATQELLGNPEHMASSVEALEQMTTLFHDSASLLLEQGVVREPEGKVWELHWPVTKYFRESEMPQYPKDEGSPQYKEDYKDRREHGYLESASMRFDSEDQRLKSAQFSFVLPDEDGDPCRDRVVWWIQAPKEQHQNGQPRMIVDIYESPGGLLAAKIKELEKRHERTDGNGKSLGIDSDAYNADIYGEYSELYKNIYKRTNNLGIPVTTHAHRRYVLGRDGFIDPVQQQEIANLMNLVTAAVEAGVEWRQAFRSDPEEFQDVA